MYYKLENDIVKSFADWVYEEGLLVTDYCSASEYKAKPYLMVVGDIEEEVKVYEYEKKIIQVPIYNEEGEIIGYEDKEVDDLDKPIMVEETIINPETGEEETILVHKFHYETVIKRGLIPNPNFEEEDEQARKAEIAKLSLTKREVFLALYRDKGLTPDVIRSGLESNPEALIEFDYAERYFRGNPLVDIIGSSLGYSSDDMDYLFEHKEFPKQESEEE